MMTKRVGSWALILALAAATPLSAKHVKASVHRYEVAIAQAVNSPDRLASDKQRDADRHPVEILEFFGAKPGQNVLDLFSGGGYWDEIFARLVGPKGTITAHNSLAELGFAKTALVTRDYAHRLPQVKLLMAENNQLTLKPHALDLIWYSQSYHDIALDEPKDGWPKINGDQLRAELFEALKPGGVLAIIDHVAVAGSDPILSGQKLHRIDPQVVRRELEAAGFKLEATSALLANPNDDHTKIVFDPTIRGKTDQFVMLFRKPKA